MLCLQPKSQPRDITYLQTLEPHTEPLCHDSPASFGQSPPETKVPPMPSRIWIKCHINYWFKNETIDQQPPSSEQSWEGAPSAWLAFLEQPQGWNTAGNTQIHCCGRPGCRGWAVSLNPTLAESWTAGCPD